MQFRFDEKNHIYYMEDKPIPSVTQIIEECLPMQYKPHDWYLTRGRAVHQCAAYIAQEIDFTYDEQIEGQVQAIKKFFREVQPIVINFEQNVYSEKHRFAGTFDLHCIIDNLQLLLDYKSTIDIERIALQLAGYSIAYGGNIRIGIGVQLKEDGNYLMTEPISLTRYYPEILALRSVYGIRDRMGLNKLKGV